MDFRMNHNAALLKLSDGGGPLGKIQSGGFEQHTAEENLLQLPHLPPHRHDAAELDEFLSAYTQPFKLQNEVCPTSKPWSGSWGEMHYSIW